MIDRTKTRMWWTNAIIDADECGRGLLRWDRQSGTWVLTGLGFERLSVISH